MTTDTLSPPCSTQIRPSATPSGAGSPGASLPSSVRRRRPHPRAQQQPDGTPFEPRKPQGSRCPAAQGKIRQHSLRAPRHPPTAASAPPPTLLQVSFTGRDERIARVHRHGLTDAVGHVSPSATPSGILGITDADRAAVAATVMAHITGA